MSALEMLWGALMAAVLGAIGFASWIIRRHAEKLDRIPEKYATREDLRNVADRIEKIGDKMDMRLETMNASIAQQTGLLTSILREERAANQQRQAGARRDPD